MSVRPSSGSPRVLERGGHIRAADGSSLYVRVYLPAGGRRRAGVVLVPADGEERTWSQRAWVNLARALAARGSPVFRFDFRGQGESDRTFEDTDVRTRLEDLSAVAGLARASFAAAPALVGLRLGAGVAARFASLDPSSVARVVAVEPVASSGSYVEELLKRNVASQFIAHKRVMEGRDKLLGRIRAGSPVGCNGFLLARPFLESLDSLPDAAEIASRPDVFVIGVGIASRASLRVEGVPPFWVEGPTYRSHPARLFDAIGDGLEGLPAASDGPFPGALEARTASGRAAVDLGDEGRSFCATLHDAPGRERGFLFLSPGPNDRSGPHGLYGRLASALAASGSPVLRVDPVGVGESHGDDSTEQDRSIAEVYREINEGRHVPAAEAGIAWLRERGVREIVLFGLCGGASTAALAAGRGGARGLRLVLLGMPVLHQGVGVDQVLSERHVDEEMAVMRGKLRDPAAILRLLTFRSDYRVIGKVLRARLARLRPRRRRDAALHPQTNRNLLEAWERFRSSSGRTTFVYSEQDRLLALFREHFAPLARGQGLPPGTDLRILEGTNHNVTDRGAERRLAGLLEDVAAGREFATSPPAEGAPAGAAR